MNRRSFWLSLSVVLGMLVSTAAISSVGGGDEDDDRRVSRVATRPALLTEECGACHVVYPARMLPENSWARIMETLDDHFGTDASLDTTTAASILRWLTENAMPSARAGLVPEDRITRTRWFRHEHDEIDVTVWRAESVRSAANCGACHAGAQSGDFEEHRVRVPPGLNASQRRSLQD